MTSKHYSKKRNAREHFINKHMNGDGNIIDSFEINRHHKDGKEIHSITDTGLIIIHNKDTGKLVTKLIARPQQIERYYRKSNKEPPKWLLQIAEWHKSLNYNVR